MKIEVGNKKFDVTLATTDEEKEKGLQGVTKLGDNEGMLFVFDEPQTVGFWMKDTKIPLDIVFINEDSEVTKVHKGKPEDETIVEEDEVILVLEVNQNSGIKEGDELELEDEKNTPVMKVLSPDGSTQMELEGGERIFSRKNTKTLIRMAKRANKSKQEKDYKALGKKIFQYLKIQDSREPEYISVKD